MKGKMVEYINGGNNSVSYKEKIETFPTEYLGYFCICVDHWLIFLNQIKYGLTSNFICLFFSFLKI